MFELLRRYIVVLLVSMVPIIELRGAIPIGVVGQQLPALQTLIAAVIGNMLPVPIILLLAKKVLLWCCTWPGVLGRFFSKIHEKGMRAGRKIEASAGRGIYWGLFLFVASVLSAIGDWKDGARLNGALTSILILTVIACAVGMNIEKVEVIAAACSVIWIMGISVKMIFESRKA